uniref:Uncharacterized protein n=1 Tax=Anopheles atroparvus TaxID=41427 RepID=A0A182IYY2_ANOAO
MVLDFEVDLRMPPCCLCDRCHRRKCRCIVVAELASPVTGVLVVVHINFGAATDIVDDRRVNSVVVVSSSSRVVVRFNRNTSSPLATIAAINSTAQVVDFIVITVVIVLAVGVRITPSASSTPLFPIAVSKFVVLIFRRWAWTLIRAVSQFKPLSFHIRVCASLRSHLRECVLAVS